MRGSRHHRPDIQGLRAVAVAAVVLYHADVALPGGFVGVDVFFVISGYVIGGALQREWGRTGTIDLPRFFLRRIRRLLPAFAVMVSTVLLLGMLFSPVDGMRQLGRTGLAASLLNANSYLMVQQEGYFDASVKLNALLHTWSLSVEEQFYLVVPLILLAVWRLSRRFGPERGDAPVAIAVAALAAASGALMLWLTYRSGLGASWAFYLAPARAWEFLAGVLLVLVRPSLARLSPRLATPSGVVGATLVVGSMVWFDEATVFPGLATLVPVIGTLGIVVAGDLNSLGPVPRLLAARVATRIGDLSYGWYLWHWPAIVFARAWWPESALPPLVGAVVSLALAAASFRWIEEPIRRASAPRPTATLRLGFRCVASGVLLGCAVIAAAAQVSDRADVEALEPHWPHTTGCDQGRLIDDLPDACTSGRGGLDVFVIGDSVALQLVDGVQAAVGPDDTVTAAGLNACPFVDLRTVRYAGTPHTDLCRGFVEGTIDHLVEHPPDVVVVASSARGWVPEGRLLIGSDGRSIEGVDQRAAAWDAGLERALSPLVGAGIDVILVHGPPHFGDWRPGNCAVARFAWSAEQCAVTQSRADVEAARAASHAAEVDVAARLGIRTLDLVATLCDENCATWDQGWVMRDAGHLTVGRSEDLGPELAAVLWGERSVLREVAD